MYLTDMVVVVYFLHGIPPLTTEAMMTYNYPTLGAPRVQLAGNSTLVDRVLSPKCQSSSKHQTMDWGGLIPSHLRR